MLARDLNNADVSWNLTAGNHFLAAILNPQTHQLKAVADKWPVCLPLHPSSTAIQPHPGLFFNTQNPNHKIPPTQLLKPIKKDKSLSLKKQHRLTMGPEQEVQSCFLFRTPCLSEKNLFLDPVTAEIKQEQVPHLISRRYTWSSFCWKEKSKGDREGHLLSRGVTVDA